MRQGSAHVLDDTQLSTYNPENDFTATYVDTPSGRYSGRLTVDQLFRLTDGRLSQMTHGTFVIIRGTIEWVRPIDRAPFTGQFMDQPAASVGLSSNTGATTLVVVNPREYERVWGYLVMGRMVSISGRITKPGKAPEFLTLDYLLVASSDAATRETCTAGVL